jgi:hypothetical protein
MGARKNNRRQKAEVEYDGHNRKAGVSASRKAGRNQRKRRRGNAGLQNMVKSYVPHLFSK